MTAHLGTTAGIALDPYVPVEPCHKPVQVLCPSIPKVSYLDNVGRVLVVQQWIDARVDTGGPHLRHYTANLSGGPLYSLEKQLL